MAPGDDRRNSMFPVSDRVAKPGVGTVANWAAIGIFAIPLFSFFAQARNFLMPVTLVMLLFFVFDPFRRLMQRLGVGAVAADNRTSPRQRSAKPYLGAITLINACRGIAVGRTMWACDMPSPVLFGLAAFLLNHVPCLGSVGDAAIPAATKG
ncbi:MAG: hypothetical protein KA156_09255 [Paracoccus sp.]|nr:hypothetical protein [Paracoccus sp. (in: a-proteobacteria)]